jgi:cytochrome c553
MRSLLPLLIVILVLGSRSAASSAEAGHFDSPGASKSMVCTACHGPNGNSLGETIPIIAGMAPNYFKKAIKDYSEGKRPSPEMEPFSKYVTQAGVDEIAGYFAEQKRQPPRSKIDANAAKRGAKIGAQCAACHGPQGNGDAEHGYPALRGQPIGYLQLQSVLFKEDKRKLEDAAAEDTKKKMMKALSDSDISDLAAYFASLR